MEALGIDIQTASAALSGFAYSALLLVLIWSRPAGQAEARIPILYGAALAASAAWGWLSVAEPFTYDIPTLAVSLADLTRYACWFAFLLGIATPPKSRTRPVLAAASATLVLAGLALLAAGNAPHLAGAQWERWMLYVALGLPVCGLMLVEQLFRNVAEGGRWSAKPLCLGLSVIFVFDLYIFSQGVLFAQPDPDAIAIRGAVHALAVPLLFLSSRRHADWLGRMQVSRTAAFHSAALALAGGYLLAVAAIGYYIRYFGGAWGGALQLIALVAALILLVGLALSGTMRARLRVLIGKHFFRYRYDYREEWLRLTAVLSAKTSPGQMGTLVIRGLADLVESPAGGLWARGPDGLDFVQTARWNVAESKDREPSDSPFARFLLERGWIVDVAQCQALPAHYDGLVLPEWLAGSRYWIVIPLIAAEDLFGFVALAPPRAPVPIDWEVTDLLKTASRQAAGFLSQMYATEALLEARKFDAFHRMSAFVVHDLKNIVTQLSLVMKNARRLRDNPEFQQDMLDTVEGSLDKMRQLMLQLREGEAPTAGHGGVDLVQVLRKVEAMAEARGRKIDVQVAEAVVTRGHEQRIERVIGHLAQNALDATDPAGRVWMRLSRHSGQARVEVGDTGKGMSPEFVQTLLFRPFQSTKTSGMGIGAYESFQYIRELGGHIAVDSAVGRGTIMTVTLPLFDAQHGSELQMAGAK